jgi:hypothetical protein
MSGLLSPAEHAPTDGTTRRPVVQLTVGHSSHAVHAHSHAH